MKLLKLLSKNFICITKEEFELMFKQMSFRELENAMRTQGISFQDLADDTQKMIEISGTLSDKLDKNNDESEIFAAFYIFLQHYAPTSRICFELKSSFNHRVDRVDNYEKLNDVVEKNTPVDFGIESDGEIRLFQLKRYRNLLTTIDLLSFIKSKLAHYGNLGDINLLIVLQGGGDISSIDFEELNKSLIEFNPTYNAQILIAYNELNETSVINQVFPELTTSRIPINLFYPELTKDYEFRTNQNSKKRFSK